MDKSGENWYGNESISLETPMPIIFNRDNPEYSVYQPELTRWENSGKDDYIAMANNMRYDPRVSKGRERRFRRAYFEPHRNLNKALLDHWRQEVMMRGDPEFCDPICNNFIANCPRTGGRCCIGFDDNIDIATVINLNGYLQILRNTPHTITVGIPEWRDFLDIDTFAVDARSNMDVWLDRYMETNYTRRGNDPAAVETFLDVVFKILNQRMAMGLFYQPVWVTKWDNLRNYISVVRSDGSLDVDRWNQVVGVPRNPFVWQIVVKYPVSAVSCLHRPSVLDGGTIYGQHFPTPPRIRRYLGGHTMDLGTPDDELLPEFIHPQIPLDVNQWISAGRLIGKTVIPDYYSILATNRHAHHRKLIDRYGDNRIRNWMPNPM
ncbi:MAG: hypothetical protein ACKVQJ_03615 [Pyrinomonadaceae bacterium]